MKPWPVVIVLILLATPLASASQVTGDLVVNAATLPTNSTTSGTAVGFMANDSTITTLVGAVAHLHVVALDSGWLRVQDVQLQSPGSAHRDDRNLTNARVVAVVTSLPFVVGGYPTGGSVALSGGSEVVPKNSTAFGDATGARELAGGSQGEFTQPWYTAAHDGAQLLVKSSGEASFSGSWGLKVRGMHVVVDADEGRFVYDTDVTQDSPVQETYHWIVLESNDLTLEVSSPAPMIASLASANATWRGTALVTGDTGTVSIGGRLYDASSTMDTISGDLGAAIAPEQIAGQVVATLGLSGDLASSTLHARPIPQTTSATASASWAAVLAAGMLGGVVVGGVVLATRRSSRRRERTKLGLFDYGDDVRDPHELKRLVDDAAQQRRWTEAARFSRRLIPHLPYDEQAAREAELPSHKEAEADLALFLQEMGEYEEARDIMDELCHEHPHDAQLAFELTLLASKSGAPVAEVVRLVQRVLSMDPAYWQAFQASHDTFEHQIRGLETIEARRALREAAEKTGPMSDDDDYGVSR